MNILIIEGKANPEVNLNYYLTLAGFTCVYAAGYFEGLKKASEREYSCIVLDISFDSDQAMDILAMIKREGKSDGIVIISSNDNPDQKIDILNNWADDFLTQPFIFAELAARINAVIRRRTFNGKDKLTVKDLTVFLNDRTAMVNENLLSLTKTEYELLVYFLTNPNRVITKTNISQYLFPNYHKTPLHLDIVYSHVMNLRKKLQTAGAKDYIKTLYGMGYRLNSV